MGYVNRMFDGGLWMLGDKIRVKLPKVQIFQTGSGSAGKSSGAG